MKRLIVIIILSSLALFTKAQEVRIKGTADFKFSYANIKAGEDFATEASNKGDEVDLSIRKMPKNKRWYVTVSKSDINWPSDVSIYVRRTSGGSGNGYIWGGTNYTCVRNMPQYFFMGSGSLNNINLQYKLKGLSLSIPSNTYYTDIVYTLYEL
jgi:hypothetical protein